MVRPKSQSERHLEILKNLNDVVNVSRESRKQVQYRDSLKNICFLDDYRDGQLALILDFDLTAKGKHVGPGICEGHAVAVDNITAFILGNDSLDVSVRDQFEQQEVFVRNIELVKGPDNAVVPSLVWLNVGNNGLEEGGAGDIYFSPLQGTFNMRTRWERRKFGVVVKGGGNESFNCGYPGKVESGVKVVDSIAYDQRQFQQCMFESWEGVYQHLVASFRISLDCSQVSLFQRDDSCLKLIDMFIGPIDLQASISKTCSEVTTFG